MKNQIVFIDHSKNEIYESLGISEERHSFLKKKAMYYLGNWENNNMSEAIEKLVEDLNPNETVIALLYLFGERARIDMGQAIATGLLEWKHLPTEINLIKIVQELKEYVEKKRDEGMEYKKLIQK